MDSLRGLASLIVVACHLFLSFNHTELSLFILQKTPLNLLFAGRGAILLFFILSGFTLNLSLRIFPGSVLEYGKYLLRRFCRIVLPFAGGILVSAGLYFLVNPHPVSGLTRWFIAEIWSQPLSWDLIAKSLLLTGRHREIALDNVIWSLVYEVRISLIFPFLAIFCKKMPRSCAGIAALIYIFSYLYLKSTHDFPPYCEDHLFEALIVTFYYLPFFVVGILLCNHRKSIGEKLQMFIKKVGSLLPLIVGLMLFRFEDDAIAGLGAFLLMVFALEMPKFEKFLLWRPFERLGKISYSLYLLHLPVLGTLFYLFYDQVSWPILVIATVLISLLAAQIFYLLVEAPATRLGTRFKPNRITAN